MLAEKKFGDTQLVLLTTKFSSTPIFPAVRYDIHVTAKDWNCKNKVHIAYQSIKFSAVIQTFNGFATQK